MLEIIAPPFSDDLIALFLPLVSDEEIFDKAAQVKMLSIFRSILPLVF